MIFYALQEKVLMKKVSDAYSSKNDINIKQIVAAITAHFKPMVFDRVEYIEKNIVEPLISENF